MNSSRLPGKAVADLCGEPLLARLLQRLSGSRELDQLVLATTLLPADDRLGALAAAHGIAWVRGSEDDVLDRMYQAACQYHADIVVRLTADNPLVDGALVDLAVSSLVGGNRDYAAVSVKGGFPLGISVEVCRMAALQTAWQQAIEPCMREHVTPFIHTQPERFSVEWLVSDTDYSSLRVTVDTPEDLALIRCVFAHFGRNDFAWEAAARVCLARPEWTRLNQHIQQKSVDRVA
ncbi:MAG: glycosyltransferase family protein [Planctomycetia bacterium]|nr:glycosyltransferase family protein [Planctomycetia bacterium]